jgi:hypothetical protein
MPALILEPFYGSGVGNERYTSDLVAQMIADGITELRILNTNMDFVWMDFIKPVE